MSEETAKDQERNIMILFLSSLHRKRDGDETKLLWNSTENEYSICQSSQTVWCMETNEAPLKEVLTTIGKPLDAIFYFASKQVGMYPPPNGEPLKKRIPIFFPPNYISSKWYDSEAHFFWTVRAKEVVGDLLTEKTQIVPVPFDDDGKGNFVGEAISAVRLMESAIKQYLQVESIPLDHCYLYADITGGKRTANMAMSAVIQLLQYEGVHLRRVVYSDYDPNRKGENGASPIHPVGNVQPIHDMHRLVAGVDAFEKYGSSAALNDFFKDEIKPGQAYKPLATLLSAMDQFSEAVLLCQPGSIETHLQTLVDALEKFPPREKEPRPAKVELLARMLPELKLKYLALLQKTTQDGEHKADRLAIIHWCVKNTLIQQAVTFCTEWLPEYLIEHGVVYTDDIAVQSFCVKKPEFEDYRSGKMNFLMKFCTLKPWIKKDGKSVFDKITDSAILLETPKQVRNLIRQQAQMQNLEISFDEGSTRTSTRWKFAPSMLCSALLDFLKHLQPSIQELKEYVSAPKTEPFPLSENSKRTKDLLRRIYGKTWNTAVSAEGVPTLATSVFQRLYQWNLQQHEEFFNITDSRYKYSGNYRYRREDIDNFNELENNHYSKMGDKCINVGVNSRILFRCGIMKTALPNETDALEFIREYTYIRAELRNKMDHAKEAQTQETDPNPYVKITISDITDYLKRYLASLEKVKNQHHADTGLWKAS